MDEDFNEYGHYEDDLMEWETEQVYQDMRRERAEEAEDGEESAPMRAQAPYRGLDRVNVGV